MYIWIWLRAPAMPRNKLRKDFGVGVGDAKIRQTSKTMLGGRVMFIRSTYSLRLGLAGPMPS